MALHSGSGLRPAEIWTQHLRVDALLMEALVEPLDIAANDETVLAQKLGDGFHPVVALMDAGGEDQRRDGVANAKDSEVRLIHISSRLAGYLKMAKTDPEGRDYKPEAFVFGELGLQIGSIKKA
jgi:hypothetical protein